jgi:hypothetical protein
MPVSSFQSILMQSTTVYRKETDASNEEAIASVVELCFAWSNRKEVRLPLTIDYEDHYLLSAHLAAGLLYVMTFGQTKC